ncbi:choline ABC transporter substrate-binding protein [Silvanigrella aquatica]|uniref:Glycine/betaine ABC transporter substrate-binding protein n=1 Tax=Silvanigrella aquatica TaxID=1915309 RepID=A0A1L4D3K5_9BACT|nr:choline ABC transporter substrate-binding protein [Silvanigrella aquatica]APJ04770.1 glycine/betaine ABC transporter substrate-binding protein [Silvanigrella aquatica]
MHRLSVLFSVFFSVLSLKVFAAVDCKKIRFSNVGWTDVTASTAIASEILNSLGYETKSTELSVPMTFASLKNKDIDVFLGNWMPTMTADIRPYQLQGSIETVGTILRGAKYTLAVPSYVYDAGVKTFSDLNKFKDKFQGKIYGIESGNDGNRHILDIIKENAFNLNDWKLIESSEQAMLMEVIQATKRNKWIVFLGWEPHPMNKLIKMQYLDGGDKYFGPHDGESTVYINTRKGYSTECPNVIHFFKNFNLTVEDENQMMDMILARKMEPTKAAQKWLKENVPKVEKWLIDVKLSNGTPVKIDELKNKFASLSP